MYGCDLKMELILVVRVQMMYTANSVAPNCYVGYIANDNAQGIV